MYLEDWQYFILRPEIKSLPLMEQKRQFLAHQLNYDRMLTEANAIQQQMQAQSAASAGGGKKPGSLLGFQNKFSLNFDGTEDFISFGAADATALTSVSGQMTISFWIKCGTQYSPGSGAKIIKGGSADGNAASWFSTGISIQGDILRLRNLNNTIYNLASPTLGNEITDNQWHHVVIQTNPDETNRIDCIVDNSTRIQVATDYRFAYNGSYANNSSIIEWASNTSNGFLGNMDEFAYWNTQLTDSQITTLYNGGVPNDITPLNPISWFRFEEGLGTAAKDTMGNNADGIIQGATFESVTPS